MVNSSESQMDNDLLNESRSSSAYAKDDDSGVNEDINSKLSPGSNNESTDDIKSSHLRSMINKENSSRCLI